VSKGFPRPLVTPLLQLDLVLPLVDRRAASFLPAIDVHFLIERLFRPSLAISALPVGPRRVTCYKNKGPQG